MHLARSRSSQSRAQVALLLLIVSTLRSSVASSSLAQSSNFDSEKISPRPIGGGFVTRSGTRFTLDGRLFYVNGFNAYWMTRVACESRDQVSGFLRQASSLGLTVARTWAFNDGGYNAIQLRPGVYSEQSLQALDFVIAEARSQGVRLLLSLSDNYDSLGGKSQYVKWARQAGIACSSDDAFFSEPTIKSYFRNYIQTVVTRVNTITKIAYRDDPTIFAWELMNEPRIPSDPSGNTLEAWIKEMSSFIKSLDVNHLVDVGMEGFYKDPARTSPGSWSSNLGSDFLRHNQIPSIDFATVHSYPDLWLPGASIDAQLQFLSSWVQEHIDDATTVLQKPVLFAEFGKSDRLPGYVVGQRDRFLSTLYSTVYASARTGGAAAGSLVWQLFADGMSPAWDDGFQIFVSQSPSTAQIIAAQSRRLSSLNR
ncbi:mannan endo-1,4-beta-mannosidase 1 [Selaginella moellendorffii]|uniref:mannan endo-1,4-beta-mannosidase 1 n=1 Tax=Selaginella moellendorffii TaxID=88036 RepID=UPI000D1C8B45|nr:mannan endo-1,4-beta-mannosidase 1 [Selaginella moellendorffii]|eukprot:XP_024543992.1 mannan endo-1,4-beta-mannosidase 1 [Selaginella moellendorffii]